MTTDVDGGDGGAIIPGRRNLYLLMQGQFVTNIGAQVFDIAMLLWIKELTGSAAIMGLAMLLTSLPEALLAPLGGRLGDRFGRLRTIILSDLVSAAAVGVVLVAVWLEADPIIAVAALCFSNVVLGLSAACFGPAVSALIPTLVAAQNLETGNAAHQFARVGGRAIGQSLGGLLFAVVEVGGTFLINAVSFLLSAWSETAIKLPPHAPPPTANQSGDRLIGDTLALLGRVWRDRNMRTLLAFIAVFHLCLSCLPIVLPFYAEHVLTINDSWFGVFVAIYTLGILLGFVVAGLIKSQNRLRLIATAGGIVGVLFFGLVVATSALVTAISLLGIGLGIGVVIVNLMTELQLAAAEAERGGIMGAAQAIGGSSLPIGMGLRGLVLDGLFRYGVSYEAATRGILATAASLAVFAAATALLRKRPTP